MKESKFSTLVSKHLKKEYGVLVIPYTVDAMATKGIPDLIINWHGKFVAIELKTGNYQPTPIQIEMITRINAWYGGLAFVLRDTEDWKETLRKTDEFLKKKYNENKTF